VGVDAGTGQVFGARQIAASADGHRDAVRWARGLHAQRVWAIEDCRHVSRRLEQALIAAGERVVRVPPKLAQRTTSTRPCFSARHARFAMAKDRSRAGPGETTAARPERASGRRWRRRLQFSQSDSD
jgi:hypothetical protein